MADLYLIRVTERTARNTDKAGPGVGDADARTFFALKGTNLPQRINNLMWVFAPNTDPRSANLHRFGSLLLSGAGETLRDAGLNPDDHSVWYIPGYQIEETLHTWPDWHANDDPEEGQDSLGLEFDDSPVTEAIPEPQEGDRVRVTGATHYQADRIIGKMGTLRRTNGTYRENGALHPFIVDVDGEGQGWLVATVAPLAVDHEPQVGDRIRVTSVAHDLTSMIGEEGVYVGLSLSGGACGNPFSVRLDGRTFNQVCSGIELIEPRPASEVDTLKQRIAALEEDRAKVAAALEQEAVDREWCREYEDFIDHVNPTLNEPAFKPRKRSFDVDMTVTVQSTSSAEAWAEVQRTIQDATAAGDISATVQRRR